MFATNTHVNILPIETVTHHINTRIINQVMLKFRRVVQDSNIYAGLLTQKQKPVHDKPVTNLLNLEI